ncbi:hypothetical protein [Alicyclobacillus fastidiosus]|uniref:hypothetical protein n=1 Tax=Alicyclobacillus fastidiosus TaxID=392011 RepID=UPI0024E168F3|nr:hypothetical protein [Alicyclobacillus fastidiosus]
MNSKTCLELIYNIVHYFTGHQSEHGRIIDPYVHQEKQYSTPAYAAVAALLANELKDSSFLDHAIRALDASLDDLIHQRAADGHSNFYTTMLVFAFHELKPQVSLNQVEIWKRAFDGIDWQSVYKPSFNNWSIVQLAGEWLRSIAGLGPSLEVNDFDEALAPHMELITEYGMYIDPNGPLAYDMFSRNYLLLILLHGYNGRFRKQLQECFRRGTFTSLFLQSPLGEMPTGGRSAQHQWNEAQQAFQFELAAKFHAKQGDLRIAGAFKRAAHLSVASIRRWTRPSGELNVVKNHASPMLRTGFESYTFHSQYNLLTAYLLALTFRFGVDSIPEDSCPAETGGFYIWIEPFFHKLVINVGGNYVQIQTRGEPIYNPTGILRIQRKGVCSLIGPSDGASHQAGKAIAYAPAWETSSLRSDVTRMADWSPANDVELALGVHEKTDKRVSVELKYRGPLNGVTCVQRRLTVTSEVVLVSDRVVGQIDALIEEIPVLLWDGCRHTDVNLSGKRLDVSTEDGRVSILCLDSAATGFTLSDAVPFRNGTIGMARYRTNRRDTSFLIHLYKAENVLSNNHLVEFYKSFDGETND